MSLDALLGVPVGGYWLMETHAARALKWKLEQFRRLKFDVSVYHQENGDADKMEPQSAKVSVERAMGRYVTRDGNKVAVVSINGTLMNSDPPSLSAGNYAITYPALMAVMSRLDADDVNQIILDINSYGGYYNGCEQAASLIYDISRRREVIAYANAMCCSAAYWLASAANQIIASPSAMVGSIGTFTWLVDSTAQDAALGLVYYRVASGEFKGLGADGQVTEQYLSETQREVDDLQRVFSQSVKRHRSLTDEELNRIEDGRVYIGGAARSVKLIDSVKSHHKMFTFKEEATQTMAKTNGTRIKSEASPLSADDESIAEDERADASLAESDTDETVVVSRSEWRAMQKRQAALETQAQTLRAEREQERLAARQKQIADAVEGWRESGVLLPKYADGVTQLLTVLQDPAITVPPADVIVESGDDSLPLYAYVLATLDSVFDSLQPAVEFGELASSQDDDDYEAGDNGVPIPNAMREKARRILQRYNVRTREVTGDGGKEAGH